MATTWASIKSLALSLLQTSEAPNWSGQGAEKLRDRIFRSCVCQLDLFLSLFPCWQHCPLAELAGIYTYTNYNILATQLTSLCE